MPLKIAIDWWTKKPESDFHDGVLRLSRSLPEGVVHGVSVVVAPVLQVDAEAVVAVVGEQMELLVAQPVFSSRLAKAPAVL